MSRVQKVVVSAMLGLSLGLMLGSLIHFGLSSERNPATLLERAAEKSSQFAEVAAHSATEPRTQELDSDWLRSKGIHSKNLSDISLLVANADISDLQTLINEVAAVSWTPRLLSIRKLMFGRLAKLAPKAALNSVWNSTVNDTNDLVDVVFREWSVRHLQDALVAAIELSRPFRDVAFTAIIAEQGDFTRTDIGKLAPSEALQSFLEKLDAENKIIDLLQNPEHAILQLVNDEIPDREQVALLGRIVDDWQPHMGFDALNALLDLPYHTDKLLIQDIVSRFIVVDPASVMDHITSGKRTKHPSMLARVLVSQHWSEIGAVQTMDAVQALEDLGLGDVYKFDFIKSWSKDDPLDVLNHLEHIPRDLRSYAAGIAIKHLAERDVDVASQWIESLKSVPGAISEFVESEWVRGWAASDPISALDWLLQNSREQSLKRSFLLPIILYEYAEVDPVRASALAEKHGFSPDKFGREN